MKTLATIFCGLYILASSLIALPVGNVTEAALYCRAPECKFWNLRVGYYGDFVFNRNLRITRTPLNQGHVIRQTRINTNAGLVAANFCNRFDVYGTVGATDFRIDTSEVSWVFNGNADGVLLTNTCFSWSVGLRGLVWRWRCFDLGLEGQYFHANPRLNESMSGFLGFINYFNENNGMNYHEWQAGGTLSYTLRTDCPHLAVVPYIGLKWSRANFNTHNFGFFRANSQSNEFFTIYRMESNKKWGYAIGSTFTICERAGITVEGRFADECAFYLNGQICF